MDAFMIIEAGRSISSTRSYLGRFNGDSKEKYIHLGVSLLWFQHSVPEGLKLEKLLLTIGKYNKGAKLSPFSKKFFW
jgi:hypothetical protein